MTAVSATLAGRAAAEALMVDACTIRHITGQTLDPDTGKYVDTYATRYTGPCKVGERDVQELRSEAGDRQVYQQARVISVPVAVQDTQVGDTVTVTASLLDQALVGIDLIVRSIPKKSFLTARRLVVEEITA